MAKQVALVKPDIILIGVDFPGHAVLSWVASLHESYPYPIVMFSKDERSETIRAATRVGVSAYAVGELTDARVKTIIESAVARFHEFQALQQELEKTKTNLAERKIIERAKELVAKQRGCNESQAYQILRKMAMNRRKRLAEISKDVLSVADVLTNKL
ncbi:MAG: ANTAR domain-containing protein [Candidatus Poribacteria bacterium]|nr:ANTAR domain-containing protein [Candidatus Poribacteria bacterium]